MAEKMATRQAYGNALAEFGSNPDILVLDADLSKSTKTHEFKKKYPERFFNMGIAEGNMMSVAAGMAACGKIVFASTFAIFAAGRACEQIRNSICYPRLNVKICVTHAGISIGEDGASHQAIEDIGLMRSLPNLTVISPADGVETREAVKACIAYDGPVYMRLGRLNVPVIYGQNDEFQWGKGVLLREGNDISIVATGLMVHEALKAHDRLLEEGIRARVINIHTLKPIDQDIIVQAAQETQVVITVEEHNIIGGLGSAVCEVLCEHHPARVVRIGIQDVFGKSGTPELLMEKYGLTAGHIVNRVKKELDTSNAV